MSTAVHAPVEWGLAPAAFVGARIARPNTLGGTEAPPYGSHHIERSILVGRGLAPAEMMDTIPCQNGGTKAPPYREMPLPARRLKTAVSLP